MTTTVRAGRVARGPSGPTGSRDAPLAIRAGAPAGPSLTTIELLDLFPTIAELAGCRCRQGG